MDFNCHLVPNLRLYLQTLIRVGIPLLILTILGTLMDQWITSSMEALLMSPTGAGKLIWFYAALSILWGLFLPLIELVLIISVLQPHPILEFWRRSFSLSLIELMRAWGKSMMWSFLFIIPGVVRFVQYLFVPFVVCLDPLYQLGERDALAQSRKLSRGRMGLLFFFFFLSAIVVPALLTVVDEWRPFVTHPVSAFLICILQMIINLTFSFWLWKIYQRSAQA